MTRTDLGLALAGLAGLAMTASTALAQQTASEGLTLRAAPDAQLTAPSNPARDFAAPQSTLTLDLPPHDAVAGLAPGQDLDGNGGRAVTPSTPIRSAAQTDTYFATRDYQDKNETIQRRGHQGAGKQFAKAGEAMAGAAVVRGIGALINGD